jgi:hypothetical protein
VNPPEDLPIETNAGNGMINEKPAWRQKYDKLSPQEKALRRARIVETIEGEDEDDQVEQSRVELPFKNVAPVEFSTRPVIEPKVLGAKTGVLPEPEVMEKLAAEITYRLRAPIEAMKNDSIIAIIEAIRKTPISLTFEDLLAVAPAVQKDTKELVTKRRVKVSAAAPTQVFEQKEWIPEDMYGSAGEGESLNDVFIQSHSISLGALPEPEPFMVATHQDGLVPKGALIGGDKVVQYLSQVPDGKSPKRIFLSLKEQEQMRVISADDSAPLRVIYPLISGKGIEEAILDGGSQIVSMALTTAVKLGLTWDPDINIYMQSANGQVEKTVGLSKNVPFRTGELTVYLQVHVLKAPAYKVLLGRPFEILTAANLKSEIDGSQMLTLTDPNTGKRCTLPTFERGAGKTILKRDTSTEIEEDTPPVEVKFQGRLRNFSTIPESSQQ